MKKIKLSFAILAMITSLSHAETSTKAVTATARINATCVLAAENITFGQYSPSAGDSFATGNIAVKCTKSTPVLVGLNLTSPLGGNETNNKYAASEQGKTYARAMANGTSKLWYNLFQDSAHTQIFGGGNWFIFTTGARPTLVGTGETQNVPVHAAMSGGQYTKAGNYTDTVVAYVTF